MGFGKRAQAVTVDQAASLATVDERVAFIRRTYVHLAGAIVAFVCISAGLIKGGIAASLYGLIAETPFAWAGFLVAFMAVGWVADRWAHSTVSVGMQYVGLALYVFAEAFIFAPMLFIASSYSDPSVIPTAGLLTLTIFAGLTGTVFITKKDFSFLRGMLMWGTVAAFGIIIAGLIFGFNLGLFFSGAMVLLASGYVLFYTSRVLRSYRTDQHVAASLALFSAIALLFWYILRIVMEFSRD